MDIILLTPYTGKILGPIAKYILGPIINGIFIFLDWILGNFDSGLVGIAIILFTLVVNLLMMPLTIKQQKFSKLSAKMNPELQAIQARYKDKKDNDSIMAMNAEQKAVYAKYGVSPSGSCVQLLIQMPIFFALYRVIYSLPAYIGTLKTQFEVIANNLLNNNAAIEEIKALKSSASYVKNFDIEGNKLNAIIDCLNSMNVSNLTKYAGTSTECVSALEKIKTYNYFLGMNLSNSPSDMISSGWANPDGRQWGLIIGAVMIPVLAGVTQWLNVKLMPQQSVDNKNASETAQSMNQSMKLMNNFMPIMSIIFCFSFSSGVGIYWIAGSVVRTIQQIIINKRIDKMDIEELIKNNEEKRRKKLEKAGLDPDKVDRYANMKTRNIPSASTATPKRSISEKAAIKSVSQKEKDQAMKEATESYDNNKKYAPGSIAAKANMVAQYNNRKEK